MASSSSLPPEEQRRVKPFDPLVLDRTVIAVPLLKEMQEDLELIAAAEKANPTVAPDKFNAAIVFNSNFPGGIAGAHDRPVALCGGPR